MGLHMHRRGSRVALAALVLLACVASAAYAGVFGGAAGNAITACAKNANGQLRVVSDPSQCLPSEYAIQLAEPQPPPGPQNVTVDCGAGQSINQAIQQADPNEPLTINIQGTCTEAVHVGRDNVALLAASPGSGIQAPSANDTALMFGGARGASVQGLTLSGGSAGIGAYGAMYQAQDVHITGAANGVQAGGNSVVSLTNVTIDGCQFGIGAGSGASVGVVGGSITGCRFFAVNVLDGADVTLNGGVAVADSRFQGVVADSGGSIQINDATISNSGIFDVAAFGGNVTVNGSNTLVTGSTFAGVSASDGGNASVTNGARVSGNGGGGVSADNGGHLLVQDGGIVENNTGPGINLTGASSLRMRGGAVVRGNSGDGVHLSDTSVAEVGDGTSQITGNGGYGIVCDGPPSVAVIRGNPGTVSSNALGQIACQSAGG
jgi:parallel beta helix pectate lyase-like protein